jgi:hypothetical protein
MTTLAERLRDAVQAQRFETLPDALRGGAPLDAYPSLDLALCCFDGDRPQALNLLFSREHPQGLVGAIAPGHGALGNIGFVADLQDGSGGLGGLAARRRLADAALRASGRPRNALRRALPGLAAQADDRHPASRPGRRTSTPPGPTRASRAACASGSTPCCR